MSPQEITPNTRIPNVTDGSHPRYSQAKKAVAVCACEWIDESDHLKGIRRLTLTESIAKRNEQAKLAEPLPSKEVANVVEHMPRSEAWPVEVQYSACLSAIYLAGSEKQKERLCVHPSTYDAREFASQA